MKKNYLSVCIAVSLLTLSQSIYAKKLVLFDIDDVLLERTSHKSTWENSGLFSSLAWNAPTGFFSAAWYNIKNGKNIKKEIEPFAKINPDVGIVEGLATTNTPLGAFLSTKLPAYDNKTVAEILIDDYIANGTAIEASAKLAEKLKTAGYTIGYATNMSDKAFSKISAKNLLPEQNPFIAATATGIAYGTKPFESHGSVLKKSYDYEKETDPVKKNTLRQLDENAEYFEKLGAALKSHSLKNKTPIEQLFFIDNKKANLAEHKKQKLAAALGIDAAKIHFIHFTLDQKAAGVEKEIDKINPK